jgi:hypothetical protein
LKPEEIYKKLKLQEGGEWVLIFTPFGTCQKGIILAKKIAL